MGNKTELGTNQKTHFIKERNLSFSKMLDNAVWYIVLGLIGLLFALPFIWMFSTSFKTATQTVAYPPEFIPNPWTLRSFYEGFEGGPFVTYFKNSFAITFLCIFGTLFSGSVVGFGFARLNAPGKNFWFILLLGTMMIPGTVTLIPVYVLYSKIGWINTIYPLVVPSFLGASAFNIFLLRQFFSSIPKELEESAAMDGCSIFKTFYLIFIPNAKPALLVVTIFTFVGTWNDFFGPMIFLIDGDKYTLAIGLNFFKSQYGGAMDMGPIMAMSLLSVAPIILLFLFAQKYFIQGITTTGLKG